jgi:hypothetical protein
MTNFIITNWITIAIVLVVLFYVGYLMFTNQWAKLRANAVSLMWRVSEIYKKNEGDVKMTAVLNIIYAQLPKWLKLFVTVQLMREILQRWYELAWDYLNVVNDVRTDKIKL